MTCRDLIDFLDDYVDERLSLIERAKFELHLAACRDCRNYLASYRETVRLARAAGATEETAAEMPADLVRAIMDSRGR
jgi:anti-sigma factor RsiW